MMTNNCEQPQKIYEIMDATYYEKEGVNLVSFTSDLFHEGVPFGSVDQVFAIMALCPQYVFKVLTKQPERLGEYMDLTTDNRTENIGAHLLKLSQGWHDGLIELPLPNVWLGVSVEDQETADERVPLLLQCPAEVRFLSLEPLLGPINLTGVDVGQGIGEGAIETGLIDWVLVGCESGPNRKPTSFDWVRDIRDQCQETGVALFVKQLEVNGRVSRNIDEWPKDLRIREFPEVKL